MGLIDYERLVETAGSRTRETGVVDLCDLATAISLGVQADTFINDCEAHAFAPSEEY